MSNPIKPLEFCVQKVLPTVYDDSLSYLEMVGRVVAKLNEVIVSDSATRIMVEEFTAQFGTDLTATVSEWLTTWKNDGTLQAILTASLTEFTTALDSLKTEHFGDIAAKKGKHHDITPFDFGAVGDGLADDTNALQTAFNTMAGSVLHLKGGNFLTHGGLTINYPITIISYKDDGKLLVHPDTSHTTDIITVRSNGSDSEGYIFRDLYILPSSGGSGRDVIRIITNSAHSIKDILITGCYLYTDYGYGINVVNPSDDLNPNGLAFLKVTLNQIWGGIKCENLGDSCMIEYNNIKGNNVGIDITQVHGGLGGSACTEIRGNNIVNAGGAIKLRYFSLVHIENNNIEQTTSLIGGYVVRLEDVINTTQHSKICGNKIITADNKAKCHGLLIKNSSNITVSDNLIMSSAYVTDIVVSAQHTIDLQNSKNININSNVIYYSMGCIGLVIDSLCEKIRINPNNNFQPWSIYEVKLIDNGIGTMGIIKTPTLINNWVNIGSGYAEVSYWKDLEEVVHLEGQVKWGDTGSAIFVFPVGFKPLTMQTFPTATATGYGNCNVKSSGNVEAETGGNGQYSLCGITFKASA